MQASKRGKRGASPPAARRSFEDAVCERWAHTHDATAAVLRGPAPGIALRLRGGHQAVLALPGWAARGPACAADDDGLEIRFLDAHSSLPLLHCRALLCDDVAVLLDARDCAADDAQARWVRTASERLAGQLPARGDALARLVVVLDALWDASERNILDELFAAAAEEAAAVAANAAAERAAQRAAAEVGRVSGEQMMEVLRTVLRHALETFSSVDILACRATCVPWCRAASDPACFARLTLPAGSEPPRLRAWLRLAAGDCGTWARETAEHAAHNAVQVRHTRAVVFAGTQLDLTQCESIEYAELLREAQRAAAVLTSLRLSRLEVTGLPRPAPGVLIPAQLRSLVVAAPLLRDICVSRITMHRVHEGTALAGALEQWAQTEGERVTLRLEELVIDATILRGHLNPFAARQWLPRSVMRLTDSLFHAPQLEELMRRLPAATRVLLRLPYELNAEVLEQPPQNWEHLRQRSVACGIRNFANFAQRCNELRECVRQLCDDARVTVQLED